MPRAHQYRGPISSQGPSIPRAHGGPYMLRAHPCRGPIPPKGPWGHPYLGPIHFPSMPKIHPWPGPIHPEGPCRPIHTQGQAGGSSLPRAHPFREFMGTSMSGAQSSQEFIPAQGPSIPRAIGAHPFRGPIPALGPTTWRIYEGSFMPSAHPGRGPIHAQAPSMPRAHPCLGAIHPEGL